MSTSRRRTQVGEGPPAEQVLVALMNHKRDLAIAREQHWYRIPVRSAPQMLEAARIAVYQTQVYGDEKWSIRYWAEVKGREVVKGYQLLPEENDPPHANREYYKFELGELQQLATPIISRRGRRLTFLPTTLHKFQHAQEINDLFQGSPLEDNLWAALKQEQIDAERQLSLVLDRVRYHLDFALFCQRGQIDVECNSENEDPTPEQIDAADARDDALARHGWSVLRFTGRAIRDALPACLGLVRQIINRQGGLLPATGTHPWYKAERG